MAKVHAKLQGQPLIDPFRPLLKGESSLTLTFEDGHSTHFELVPSHRTRAKKMPSGWQIEHSGRIGEASFHQFLWRLLSNSEKERMKKRVHHVNVATLDVPVSKVNMRLTRSRWGSCSHTGSINLSTALLFVSLPLQEYVIVHELAHRLHPNHSAAFWRTVTQFVPKYLERVKDLRKYRLARP